MARYQVLIEYVGTSFRVWQIQKKGSTIQGLIQQYLSKLLKEKIILNGSGRTDAGVHAYAQSAHFDCQKKILDLNTLSKVFRSHFFSPKYFRQPTIDLTCCCKNDCDLNSISILFFNAFILIDLIVLIGLLA